MQTNGNLAANVMHFARVLRRAGLPAGPDRVIDALRALEITGLARRDDFYWALAAVFLDRREQRELFDQAFHIFWRDPDILGRVMQLLLPRVEGRGMRPPELPPRLAEALAGRASGARAPREAMLDELAIDAALTFSPREILARKDFAQMTSAEWLQAKTAVAALRLRLPRITTRRYQPATRSRAVDARASLRAALRAGSGVIPLKHRAPRLVEPPLVVLCDISGSMDRYSRMLLHFVHALANDARRIHAFVFGTRLTNITHHLRHCAPDLAVAAVSRAVAAWSGGTRLGACLKTFNLEWSRRVLGQNASVLLISDGLDRDDAEGLAAQMQRLHDSCRELIWLNPLLRYPGFEARPAGIRMMLPHVDRFLPVHNLESLAELATAIAQPPRRTEPARAA
ncbi:MAG: VWA domain-containing protein [Betaproteobacteria bacterium]|nr:MAG: VWA domain-containing protein [Betaproteobacteria bacterium]